VFSFFSNSSKSSSYSWNTRDWSGRYERDDDRYCCGSYDWYGCKPPVEPKVVSVGDSRAVEGQKEVFAVTLSGKVVSSLTVSLALSDVSATAGQDYRTTMEVSFDGGCTWKSVECSSVKLGAGVDDFLVRVGTIDDTRVETEETFTLKASANGGTDCGTGVIVDNDCPAVTPKVLSVSDASAEEGVHAVFTVRLSEAGSAATAVALALAAGSASAGADYPGGLEASFDGGASWVAVSGGSVSVPAGKTEFLVRAATTDDLLLESNETFTLRAATADSSATGAGTILDNDLALPAYTISNDTRFEGETLLFDLAFASTPLTAGIIQLTLADNTATAGQDYASGIEVSRDGGTTWTTVEGGLLNVAAGDGAFQLRVQALDDFELEPLETLTISAQQLSTGVVVAGVGEIIDNDTAVARVPPTEVASALKAADVLQDDSTRVPDAGSTSCPTPAGATEAAAELLLCADELARQLAAAKPVEYA